MTTTTSQDSVDTNQKQDPVVSPKNDLVKKIFSSDTLILATIPIICYLVVFIYDWGYLNFFKIPLSFIYFEINQIFFVFMLICSIGLIIFVFGDTLFSIIKTAKPPIRRKLNTYLPSILIFIIYFFIFGRLWKYWLSFLLILVFLFLVDNLFIIFTHLKIKGFVNKYQAYYDEKDKRDKKDTYITSYEKIFRFLGPYFSVFIVSLYFVYFFGQANAMTKKEYYVVNTSPERIVVWSTDKYSICYTFDRNNETFDQNYVILDYEGNSDIEYSLQEIGPLVQKIKSE